MDSPVTKSKDNRITNETVCMYITMKISTKYQIPNEIYLHKWNNDIFNQILNNNNKT